MRFAGVDMLVQVADIAAAGTEDTSVASRVLDAYEKVEESLMGVAASVAGTVAELRHQGRHPKQVQVAFGLGVSLAGDVMLVQGTTQATLGVTLTYEIVD